MYMYLVHLNSVCVCVSKNTNTKINIADKYRLTRTQALLTSWECAGISSLDKSVLVS